MKGETTVAPRPSVLQMPVGAQPDLGREQFRGIDAEQDRGLHVDRDDQYESDIQHDGRIGRSIKAGIDGAADDGYDRRADDAPARAAGV
jgi:hypothetical protein